MFVTLMSTTGFLFWCIVGIVCLLDVLALSTEDDGFGMWAVFATIATLVFSITATDAFAGINLIWLPIGLIAYSLIGVCWSFQKWIDYVREVKQDAVKRNRDKPITDDLKPKASDNKQRLITWMTVWPLSFVWWVLTYPRHFFVWAYHRLSTVYDRISTKIWESA